MNKYSMHAEKYFFLYVFFNGREKVQFLNIWMFAEAPQVVPSLLL